MSPRDDSKFHALAEKEEQYASAQETKGGCRKQRPEGADCMSDLKKFRVTHSWLTTKYISAVFEARNESEARRMAEQDGLMWEITESDGEIGTDRTEVETVPDDEHMRDDKRLEMVP